MKSTMLRHCCICHEPFAVTSAHRTRIVCYEKACAATRAKQRRVAFEARRQQRIVLQAAIHATPPVVRTPPPPDPPRPTRLPDGSYAYVVWAGDMAVKPKGATPPERGRLYDVFSSQGV